MGNDSGTAVHWDDAYSRGARALSWFQQEALPSLQMFEAAGVEPGDSVIDVGAGASALVDALLDRGHADLTALDVSAEGLGTAQRRLGDRAGCVGWLVADLRDWTPTRTWQAWHDRAVLHFFTTGADREAYLRALDAATRPGSVAVLATFAENGPTSCSGLPVARYRPKDLAGLLGPRWELIASSREEHLTPGGRPQPFTWAAFRRQA